MTSEFTKPTDDSHTNHTTGQVLHDKSLAPGFINRPSHREASSWVAGLLGKKNISFWSLLFQFPHAQIFYYFSSSGSTFEELVKFLILVIDVCTDCSFIPVEWVIPIQRVGSDREKDERQDWKCSSRGAAKGMGRKEMFLLRSISWIFDHVFHSHLFIFRIKGVSGRNNTSDYHSNLQHSSRSWSTLRIVPHFFLLMNLNCAHTFTSPALDGLPILNMLVFLALTEKFFNKGSNSSLEENKLLTNIHHMSGYHYWCPSFLNEWMKLVQRDWEPVGHVLAFQYQRNRQEMKS